ncbi:S-adenosyl-L-methionine-dependent methyltransferase [Phytophthora cactorum]|nr:S-adenosyl-L-methionine-dependent methyltransferase [Phytophthora cactorum]
MAWKSADSPPPRRRQEDCGEVLGIVDEYEAYRLKAPPWVESVLFGRSAFSLGVYSNVSRLRGTPHLKRKLASGTCSDTVRVLEIGPGTGNLTSALLQVSPKVQVHAVEFDPRMVEQLKLRFPAEIEAGSLVVEHSDFEDFRFVTDTDQEKNQEKKFDSCIANIPYQLSSIVVSRLSSYMHRFPTTFKCAVLLVQEEFALRLLAEPGNKNYSRLSANTALVADVTSVVKVPREHFLPPPKVDSRVIKLVPRAASTPALCFERKNKTLRALLLAKTARSQYVLKEDTLAEGQDKHQAVTERVEAALEASGLTSNRAVKISVAEFMKLMQGLHERGIDLRPSITRHFRD